MTLGSPESHKHLLASRFPVLTVALMLVTGAVAVARPHAQNPASPKPAAQEKAPVKPAQNAPPAASKAPTAASSDSSLISDFDDGKISARSGFGWIISTDSVAGGQSTAEMKVIEGGANRTKGALQITGKISDAFQYAWAGAMYSPGPQPFTPVDLSSKKALVFWAKGDGRSYNVMLFTQAGGYMPGVQSFTAGPEWKEFRFR